MKNETEDKLRVRTKALEEALRTYGGHLPTCSFQLNLSNDCTCGWRKAVVKFL